MKSDLFALERNEGLKSMLSAIYQSFNGEDLYNARKSSQLTIYDCKESCIY